VEFGAELIDRLDAAGCDSRTIFRTGVLQYDCILTRLRWQQAIRYPSFNLVRTFTAADCSSGDFQPDLIFSRFKEIQ